MSSAKQKVKEILEKLPEDSSFEDIQYHIYVREKVEKGLSEVDRGDVVGQEEVEKRMSQWTRKSFGQTLPFKT